MSAPEDDPQRILMPALSDQGTRRLIVFLHGAGTQAGALVPVALAWQIKFPAATAAILLAPEEGRSWLKPSAAHQLVSHEDLHEAAQRLLPRVQKLQSDCRIDAEHTVLVGFTQGASLALELAFEPVPCAALVIAYGARLHRVPREGDRVSPSVRLIHGEHDSVVPLQWPERALSRLQSVGADATLEIVEQEGHTIGQTMINAGTQSMMQLLFSARLEAKRNGPLH